MNSNRGELLSDGRDSEKIQIVCFSPLEFAKALDDETFRVGVKADLLEFSEIELSYYKISSIR